MLNKEKTLLWNFQYLFVIYNFILLNKSQKRTNVIDKDIKFYKIFYEKDIFCLIQKKFSKKFKILENFL